MNLKPWSAQARAKAGILREKTVAGVDRLRLAAARHVEDFVHVQVGLAGRGGTDRVGVVGLANVQRFAVHVGENGDGLNAHFAAGANDAHCNFTAIGDQDSFEHD